MKGRRDALVLQSSLTLLSLSGRWWDIISMDLILSVTKPGGITFKDNKGFYLALALGHLEWFPACGVQCAADCFQVTPAAPAEHLLALCPSCARVSFFTFRPPFLQPRTAPAFCRLLVLPIFPLFFKAIPSDSFNLRYCCGKYASGEQFHGKMLKGLDLHVACPLKLD